MNPFLIINESDIFDYPADEPQSYTPRPTSKGFVIDQEGNMALLQVGNVFGLPGGGIEGEETPESAFIRECLEEIGCKVEIVSSLGYVLQNRARLAKQQEIHYFVAQVIGEKGEPTTTEEDEKSVLCIWCTQDKVASLLHDQIAHIPEADYVMQFNARTHFAALQKFLQNS